jgi:hypothetical protein
MRAAAAAAEEILLAMAARVEQVVGVAASLVTVLLER